MQPVLYIFNEKNDQKFSFRSKDFYLILKFRGRFDLSEPLAEGGSSCDLETADFNFNPTKQASSNFKYWKQ